MTSRHTRQERINCPKPCCEGPDSDTCPQFIGKRGERGEDGNPLTHTAYRNTAPYLIEVVGPAGDITTPSVNFGNVFGGAPGTSASIGPGVHHIRYNANLAWNRSDPVNFNTNLFLATYVVVGDQRIRTFRQTVANNTPGLAEGDNLEVFLPSITFDFCVCTSTAQNISIHTVLVRPTGPLDPAIFRIDPNEATLSIDSAIASERTDPDVSPLERLRGPVGYTGDPFNTTAFEGALLSGELESFGLVYDVDNPLANPVNLQYKFGRCIGYSEPDGVGTFKINGAGHYRFTFSSTLNVDFVYPDPEDPAPPVLPGLMQVNLLATIDGGAPFIVKQLRTSVDYSSGAHKILDGFFERSFDRDAEVSFYIQYFLDVNPEEGDEWQVLLGILSAPVRGVRTETRTLRTESRPLVLVEKMD